MIDEHKDDKEPIAIGKETGVALSGTVPDSATEGVPHSDISPSNSTIWHMEEFDGAVGKKELGFVEVVFMLQSRYDECVTDTERANPQKGLWYYERTAQMRRRFKQHYPEYFARQSDHIARRKRQERQKEAEETKRDRKRRGRATDKIPAIGHEILDLQAYRDRAGS